MGLITTQSTTADQTQGLEVPSVRLTNWGEAGGFFLARAIMAAVSYLLSSVVLAPFYIGLLHSGRRVLMTVAASGIGALMWLTTLLLFLLLRALFGGVPQIVAPQARRRAFTSSSGEVAAYIVTSLVVLVILTAFNNKVIFGVYSSLRVNGRSDLVLLVTQAVLATTAVSFFVIFVVLRRAIWKGAQTARSADQSRGGSNIGFGQAIAICFGKYAEFRGRAGRPEYWFWVLFQVLFAIALTIVDLVLFDVLDRGFSAVVSLSLFLPGLAVTVRRLHDIDYSGWWTLIFAVPVIGAIILIILTCLRGTEQSNRFGPGLTA